MNINNTPSSPSEKKRQEIQKRKFQQARLRKIRRQKLEKVKAVTLFSLIGAVLCLAVIFGYILIDFNKKPHSSSLPVKITLGGKEPVFLEKANYFYRNGEYFVSLSALSDITGFTIHGKATNHLTLCIDGNDAFTFDVGTNNVLCHDTWAVMSDESIFEKGQVFVPCSFFPDFLNGVKNEYNSKGNKEGFNIIFDSDFAPKHSSDNGSLSLPQPEKDNSGYKTTNFVTNLEEYEMYMNPQDRDEYLYLINESNPLSPDYVPEDLYDILYTRNDRAKQKMRLYAAKALEAMFIEMKANGFNDVSVTSGYRSYEYQSQLFSTRVAALAGTYGKDAATQKVKQGTAVPGTSEHQSGLCVDMHNLSAASEAFAAQPAYRWLYSNCAEFGFILRYPKNKTEITGIMFEPWHFRYVGRYHARKIMDSGVALEEYISSLK